ncbi:MAG TPA: TldD/PmbA family protein [Leptospiraceae bacterium]|nr:TldD/PmbA family protein [Leptospirales bacterium]HMU83309.1 TldD/PmbA family protein [Leptospiraceae bacterium]HMW60996.1 TldD/PmbA family protein [Leptospiraceae bacterium]HMX55858.1 TldD/PmbA family protein [Leptospiraceae bacterium]HMY43939.1 TldD/PmbA family protein [Leptospiraceae bacterium]
MKKQRTLLHDPALYDPYRGLYTRAELEKVRSYLKEELSRSLKHFKKNTSPRPHFISYLFRNFRSEKIAGRLGGITDHTTGSQNTTYCDVRVGGPKFDNVINGGLEDNSDRDESIEYINMPAEIEQDSFRFSLWKLTDAKYREAAEQYYERKSKELHYVDPNRGLPSRLKRPPVRHWKYRELPEIDREFWKYRIRLAGNLLKKYANIKNSRFEFNCHHRQSVLVNSEGSMILQQQCIFELRGSLWLLNKKGEGIVQEIHFTEGDIKDLPDEKEFLRIIREKIDRLLILEKAPRMDSYSGPVLLSPVAAGLFFHEVVGHRLEGSRLLSPDEGGTFRSLRGKRIAPDYIDIIDHPSLTAFGNRQMIGHFLYDDEGSPAEKSVLVEKGILKEFLTTSTPIPGQKKTNGHARSQKFERPISRMGNLMVVNRKPVSPEEMKERFIEEIRRQKKPYGIHVLDTLGGETGTNSYDFQAFKGEILDATRVFPDGREEPVRGVDFVGTPLSSLDSVMCMGNDPMLDNSYCGAESGVVPVSTVSPSMLMRSLELQGQDRERYTQYVVPLPYSTGKRKKN